LGFNALFNIVGQGWKQIDVQLCFQVIDTNQVGLQAA